MSDRHLVVVGAGIAGLAAAWEASSDGTRVTVVEASHRPGGKIRTSPLALGDGTTMRIDEGADAFLARVPDAVQLCVELGLEGELTQPRATRAKVLTRDGLRTMPATTVLGVPLDADELEESGILSADGVAAVRAEDGRADPPLEGDDAIGGHLATRFGRELVDHLVGPLIGGINAGDVHELSLRAVTPQLAEAAEEGGCLTDALRRRRAAAPVDGPVFHTLLGGTERLVDALVEQLRARGVAVHTDTEVVRIERTAGAQRLRVLTRPTTPATEVRGADTLGADTLEADRIVLATPAPAAATLLGHLSPDATALLEGITHASVVLVTLVYDRSEVAGADVASGFLVPRDAGLLMTAASFGSTKWAHWDDGRHVILRASAGHVHDDRPMHMDDDEVVAALRADLRTVLGITAAPRSARVARYPNGFAQYTVGHLERVALIEAALAQDEPAVRLAGAAYRGVGIPACIRQGRAAARSLLATL